MRNKQFFIFHYSFFIGFAGHLTSQFFANVYMNDFDNFIKRKLKVKRYMRYVDDFVLFDRSKQRLEDLKSEIEAYLLGSLGLSLRGGYADTRRAWTSWVM